jgi:hypothetical protein
MRRLNPQWPSAPPQQAADQAIRKLPHTPSAKKPSSALFSQVFPPLIIQTDDRFPLPIVTLAFILKIGSYLTGYIWSQFRSSGTFFSIFLCLSMKLGSFCFSGRAKSA